jgi:hypothetical protein
VSFTPGLDTIEQKKNIAPSSTGQPAATEQTVSGPVRRLKQGQHPMIAPLGTLAFLLILWLLTVVGAAILQESGSKVAAALNGKPVRPSISLSPVRVRARLRARPTRAAAQWRAAA